MSVPPSLPIDPVFFPLTPDRWDDFETLFGKDRTCDECWCMWWRQTHTRFMQNRGEANRRAMHQIVRSGIVPGIIAYDGAVPVGWCSVAPREDFPRICRSPVIGPIDDQPVWSVACFVVDRSARGRGVMRALLSGAVGHATGHGARIVEGYPKDTAVKHCSAADLYVGTVSLFTRAGFVEAARRSPGRPIMRCRIER
jgi:GNAT superfamily N-acetyltransferase